MRRTQLFTIAMFGMSALMVSCGGNKESDSTTTTEEPTIQEEPVVEEESAEEDGVYFVNLEDGQDVSFPLTVEMGVKGMILEPAGEVKEGYGHHHILVDDFTIPKGEPVPSDETHFHYGKGQSEAVLDLDLEPGEHKLTLQYANGIHISYGRSWSKTITVNVVEAEELNTEE